jgi:hypothetical protein
MFILCIIGAFIVAVVAVNAMANEEHECMDDMDDFKTM